MRRRILSRALPQTVDRTRPVEPGCIDRGKAGMTSSLKQRLGRGIGSTALGPVVTAVIQLGTVPLLLHAWGAAKYGDWLMLSAVPSYLTFANFGFGDASGSDMTGRVARGDKQGALETELGAAGTRAMFARYTSDDVS